MPSRLGVFVFGWVLPGLFLAAGGWIILLNWYCVYLGLSKKRSSSCIPLLGATLFMSGMIAKRWGGYCWLPFLLDYGSVPGLVYAAVFHIRRRSAKAKSVR